MTPDPYRKAYETAIEDLTQISQTFERLNNRKKLVENVVVALQSVFAQPDPSSANNHSQSSMEAPQAAQEQPEESAGNYSFLDVPAPLPAETDGDPFQRRVKANFRFKGLAAQRSY